MYKQIDIMYWNLFAHFSLFYLAVLRGAAGKVNCKNEATAVSWQSAGVSAAPRAL